MSILLNRIEFTELIDEALSFTGKEDYSALSNVYELLKTKRRALISEIRSCEEHKLCQLRTLITLYFEQLDVTNDLIHAEDPDSLWRDEFRFYLQSDGTVCCKCGKFELGIGDNFPQNSMLVVTTLTRDARRSIFEAMITKKIFIGAGPAGTGKTETIKDTARMLGMEPIVVNVTDKMTELPSMVLEKASKTGRNCPIIFDEVNRTSSQNLENILAACKDQFVCLTYNPGYRAGGNNPDWLRERSIQQPFTAPKFAKILSVMLATVGVQDCDKLGQQMLTCIKGCECGSSKQNHYDFGLRFMKTAVKKLGQLACREGFQDETRLLVEALGSILYSRAANTEDWVLAEAEIRKAFNITFVHPRPWPLLDMVVDATEYRHSVAVLGCPPTLQDETIAAIDEATGAQSIVVENCSLDQLHGDDGIFLKAWKAAIHRTTYEGAFVNVVLKLPVHERVPEALEPLNTVMDDNKVYVTSKARFAMTPKMRLIIFTDDCKFWLPAHVSRVAAIYAGERALPYTVTEDVTEEKVTSQMPVPLPAPVSVKISIGGETLRRSAQGCTLAVLLEWLESIAPAAATTAKLFWRDDEGDDITIKSNLDLIEAFRFVSYTGKALHIFVRSEQGC